MARKILSGHDMDTEAFAQTLRDIAEGIESHDIDIEEAKTAEHAKADDVTEFILAFKYNASTEYVDRVGKIEYVTDEDEGGD